MKILMFFGGMLVLAITSIASEADLKTAASQAPIVLEKFYVDAFAGQITVRPVFEKKGSQQLAWVVIDQVVKGSPAEKAGLRAKMIMVRVQDIYIGDLTQEQFLDRLEKLKAGKEIKISILKDPNRSYIDDFSIPVLRRNPSSPIAGRIPASAN